MLYEIKMGKFLNELNHNSGTGFQILLGLTYIILIGFGLFTFFTLIGLSINHFTKLHFEYVGDTAVFGFCMTFIGLIIYCIISNIISAYLRAYKRN